MIHLQLIGIGTGNPDHLTRAAAKAMAASNLILLPRKDDRTADLIDLRRMICAEAVTGTTRVEAFDLPARSATPDYLGDVDDWHDAISEVWAREIGVHLPGGGTVSLLIWVTLHSTTAACVLPSDCGPVV